MVYFTRKAFRDNRLLGNIENFLSIFKPYPQIESITDEKGKFVSIQNSFNPSSLFGFIESDLTKDSTYVYCDDLGDEWADFISVEEGNSVSFYHAKVNDTLRSASAFHDIVGQAQKNLGNIAPTDGDWKRKVQKWSEVYRNDGTTTLINRLRRGDSVEAGIEKYKQVLLLPNARRKVYLVVNFISRKSLQNDLIQLRETGNCEGKNQMIQMLWFLSSLIASCLEANVDVYIVCKP